MGTRNVFRYIRKAQKKLIKSPYYDLSGDELLFMANAFKMDNESLYNIIIRTYQLGFETGTRYEKNRIKKS